MSVVTASDGTKVLVCGDRKRSLSEKDRKEIEEWIAYCRERSRREQVKRNQKVK